MIIEYFSSFAPLATRYDAFILDLWGVIHDGKQLYPGAKDCFLRLRSAGKKIVLLSNAPRRASVAMRALDDMGIGSGEYDMLITSGEAAYQCLALSEKFVHGSMPVLGIPSPLWGKVRMGVAGGKDGACGHPHLNPPPKGEEIPRGGNSRVTSLPQGEGILSAAFKPAGNRYVYIGLERDRRILDGLHYEEADDPANAHFLILSHSYVDNQPLEELEPLLTACLEAHLPALCINPDSEVVRQSGERIYCAGVLAAEYTKRRGKVTYFGKPHPIVYGLALDVFAGMEKSRILAVGDSLATDIAGAYGNGLKSALITGGVLKDIVGEPETEEYEQRCKALFAQSAASPDYVLKAFNW